MQLEVLNESCLMIHEGAVGVLKLINSEVSRKCSLRSHMGQVGGFTWVRSEVS